MYVSSKTKMDVRSCQEEKKPTFCSDLDDVIMFISHRSTEVAPVLSLYYHMTILANATPGVN